MSGFERNRDFATVDRTSENDRMNEQVAYALIDAELRCLQELSYADLSALIGKVEKRNCSAKMAKHTNSKFKRFGTARKAQTSD